MANKEIRASHILVGDKQQAEEIYSDFISLRELDKFTSATIQKLVS